MVYLIECKACGVQYVISAHILFRDGLGNYKAYSLGLFQYFIEEEHQEFLDLYTFLLMGKIEMVGNAETSVNTS